MCRSFLDIVLSSVSTMSPFFAYALWLLSALASAQSCGPKPSGSIQPSLASGYQMQVVATGLSKPRGILLDNAGNLLVVEQGSGLVSAHTLAEQNGCISVTSSRNLTDDLEVSGYLCASCKAANREAHSSIMESRWPPMRK